MNSPRRRVPALSLAVAVALLAGSAGADWPVLRHDLTRTATASGASAITQPTHYWQIYMGGSLRADTHIGVDVDKDGKNEVVYLAGGKAIAKYADDRLVWESPPVELSALYGIVDLDGDGRLEVVAGSTRNVFVLSGDTGKVLWREPDGEVGNVGGVRLGDLDGDGNPEVFIDDCGCCGVSPTASPPGGVYKFVKGKLDAPTKLYTPSTRGHCGSQSVALGDFDADGVLDVAYGTPTGVQLVSGKTGMELGQSGVLGETIYYSSCEARNVDGRPGDELVCYQNSFLSTVGGGRRVFVVTYDAAATPTVKTLWNAAPVPKDKGELAFVGTSLSDLDLDGKYEVTVSWFDGGAWSTTVYDAAAGTTLGTVASLKIQGVVDLDSDKKLEIASIPGGTDPSFRAHKFSRGATPALTAYSVVTDPLRVPAAHDFSKAARSTVATVPLTVDLKGDGKVLPVLFTPEGSSGTKAAKFEALRFDGTGATTAAATFTVPDGVTVLTSQVFAKLTRGFPQLTVTRNDGYFVVLDDAFAPTNNITYGSGEFKVFLPGMRVGGFTAQPIAPRLGGTFDAVVSSDSRNVLQRLDASAAWMELAPKVSWEVRDAISPTSGQKLDAGKPGLACARRERSTGRWSRLAALSGAGTVLWEKSLGVDANVSYDALAADVNGDGVDDVFSAWITTGSVWNAQVWNGKDGTGVWPSPASEALSWGYYAFAVHDWDGNGVPDMYVVPNTLRVHHGATGVKLAQNSTFLAYFTPVVADVDGDGKAEVTMSRGYYPVRTYKSDLVTATWTGPDDRPYSHGARAACSGGRSVWVQASTQNKGLLRLTTMNGTDVGKDTVLWVAGGALYPTAADAAKAGKLLGNLGDVAVKQDLLGKGDHPSALMGSTDGFLYAVDPCAAKLDWAFDLRFAVGDPILADTSGDGADEILVPAADGYLHALGQRFLEPPAAVNDNDPMTGVPGPDLDSVATADRLAASWTAVTGADGYQVAVLTEGGSYVTQPDWVSLGAVTYAVLKDLPLVTGKKYFVAVRAVSKTKGASLEARSNGVVVTAPSTDGGIGDTPLLPDSGLDDSAAPVDASAPDSGFAPADEEKSGGCGCVLVSGDGTDVAWLTAAGALMVALAASRRRRS